MIHNKKLDNILQRTDDMGDNLNKISNSLFSLLDKEAYRRLQMSKQLQYRPEKYDNTNEKVFINSLTGPDSKAKFILKKKLVTALEPDEPEIKNVDYLINQYKYQRDLYLENKLLKDEKLNDERNLKKAGRSISMKIIKRNSTNYEASSNTKKDNFDSIRSKNISENKFILIKLI